MATIVFEWDNKMMTTIDKSCTITFVKKESYIIFEYTPIENIDKYSNFRSRGFS